jgi:uncharacterized lipoprotein YehR (DUF1307 family)
MRTKKVLCVMVAAITACVCVLSLTACDKGKDTPAVTYNYITVCNRDTNWLGEENYSEIFYAITLDNEPNIAKTAIILCVTDAKIYDSGKMPQEYTTHYVSSYSGKEENPVLVSKWVYYAMLLKSDTTAFAWTEQTSEKVKNDADCLQKYVIDGETRLRLVNAENNELSKAGLPFTTTELGLALTSITSEYQIYGAAAVAYYGLIDFDNIAHGTFARTVKCQNDTKEEGTEYNLTVVGYYEGESEKAFDTAAAIDADVIDALNDAYRCDVMYSLSPSVPLTAE